MVGHTVHTCDDWRRRRSLRCVCRGGGGGCRRACRAGKVSVTRAREQRRRIFRVPHVDVLALFAALPVVCAGLHKLQFAPT